MLGHLLTRFSIIQKMAIEVVRYTEDYLPELTIFCQKCKELGWKNNASIQALKLASPNVQYWLIFVNGEIASIAGAQEMFARDADSIIRDKDFRFFFRAATLPKYYHYYSYNRYMGNSLYIRHLTELQATWANSRGSNRLIITANTDNAGSPEMKKIARITRLNEVVNCKKRGIPPLWDELGTCTLFYTEQVIFQLIENNLKWWANKWIS